MSRGDQAKGSRGLKVSKTSGLGLCEGSGKRPLGGKHQEVVPGLLFLSPSRVPLGQTLVPMDALGDLESVAFSL